jgi:hypothetical protein
MARFIGPSNAVDLGTQVDVTTSTHLRQLTINTSNRRGPWTPSTLFNSMSLVALGPLMKVSGRVASSIANACGTVSTTWSARTMQM